MLVYAYPFFIVRNFTEVKIWYFDLCYHGHYKSKHLICNVWRSPLKRYPCQCTWWVLPYFFLNFRDLLLYIESRESFLKYQDVQCTCWVKFSLPKLKMLASYTLVFIQQNSPNRFILPVDFISQISFFIISACFYFEEGD